MTAIRPNTDTALIIALCYEHGQALYDQNFLDCYTVGFDDFLNIFVVCTMVSPKPPNGRRQFAIYQPMIFAIWQFRWHRIVPCYH